MIPGEREIIQMSRADGREKWKVKSESSVRRARASCERCWWKWKIVFMLLIVSLAIRGIENKQTNNVRVWHGDDHELEAATISRILVLVLVLVLVFVSSFSRLAPARVQNKYSQLT